MPINKPSQWIPTRRSHPLRLILPMLSLVLVLCACIEFPEPTKLPASQLQFSITFQGQYTGNTDIVLVEVKIYERGHDTPVLPAKGAHLVCNGVDVMPDHEQSFSKDCPRQPSGGTYRFTYTDEQGITTTANIPVPAGSFVVLSPKAGEKVAIPTSNTLDIHYTVPTPPPGGSVSMNEVSASCGGGDIPPCGDVAYGDVFVTGKTVSGGDGIFHLTGDFTQFQPGPGSVSVSIGVHVPVDQSGFAGVNATFIDGFAPPITWTR